MCEIDDYIGIWEDHIGPHIREMGIHLRWRYKGGEIPDNIVIGRTVLLPILIPVKGLVLEVHCTCRDPDLIRGPFFQLGLGGELHGISFP